MLELPGNLCHFIDTPGDPSKHEIFSSALGLVNQLLLVIDVSNVTISDDMILQISSLSSYNLIVAINKMDEVGWSPTAFEIASGAVEKLLERY